MQAASHLLAALPRRTGTRPEHPDGYSLLEILEGAIALRICLLMQKRRVAECRHGCVGPICLKQFTDGINPKTTDGIRPLFLGKMMNPIGSGLNVRLKQQHDMGFHGMPFLSGGGDERASISAHWKSCEKRWR